MTIVVRDDFTGTGNLDGSKWSDASTTFYKGQSGAHWLEQSGGYCLAPFDLSTPLAPSPATTPVPGFGEAVTIPTPTSADQYIEAGIFAAPGSSLYPWMTYAWPRGDMILGFRLTGGSHAIEGITVEFSPNPDGVTTQFVVSQTHSGTKTTIGSLTNVTTAEGYIVRLEVIGTSVALKVNGSTILSGSTTVTQVGNGYLYVENDALWIPPGVPESPTSGLFGSDNTVDYVEYGTFSSDVVILVNHVTVSGGGSPSASAMDSTVIDPFASPSLVFNLDSVGAGDGQHLQKVDRTAFTVGARLAMPTFVGGIGGVIDEDGLVYTEVSATPGQLWKADGVGMVSEVMQTLSGGGSQDPYPVLDAAGNVYVTTAASVSSTTLSKLRCSDMSVQATLTIPNFTINSIACWDGRAIDFGQGYLYVVGTPLGGPAAIAKIALNSLSVVSMRTLTPALNVANVLLINGTDMYLAGASLSAFATIQKFDLITGTVTSNLTWIGDEISCGVLDALNGKAYFGTLALGHIGRLDLASFTMDANVTFSGPVRALAVDDTHLYATLPPAVNGGATWWLGRMAKDITSPSYITDASWTAGSGTIQGAKTLMLI